MQNLAEIFDMQNLAEISTSCRNFYPEKQHNNKVLIFGTWGAANYASPHHVCSSCHMARDPKTCQTSLLHDRI